MTLTERLHASERASVQAYHRRTELAQQQQEIQRLAMQCDLELARLDGEIRCLTAQIAAEKA